MSSLYIFEIKPMTEVALANIFSYIVGFRFHFANVFFSRAEPFSFHEVPFVYSFLLSLAVGDMSVKILLPGISEIFLSMFFSRTL